jgi:hypothetical protein
MENERASPPEGPTEFQSDCAANAGTQRTNRTTAIPSGSPPRRNKESGQIRKRLIEEMKLPDF